MSSPTLILSKECYHVAIFYCLGLFLKTWVYISWLDHGILSCECNEINPKHPHIRILFYSTRCIGISTLHPDHTSGNTLAFDKRMLIIVSVDLGQQYYFQLIFFSYLNKIRMWPHMWPHINNSQKEKDMFCFSLESLQ